MRLHVLNVLLASTFSSDGLSECPPDSDQQTLAYQTVINASYTTSWPTVQLLTSVARHLLNFTERKTTTSLLTRIDISETYASTKCR